MSDNDDINFVLQLTKDEFDMIVTIMLHDACHDFDNDKSNAAFKEYFFSNKAAPSSAVSRLGKIGIGLGVPPPGTAGGGFMKGGMAGLGPLVLEPGTPVVKNSYSPQSPPFTPTSPVMHLPNSPKGAEKLERATTVSEKNEVDDLKSSEAQILKEILSECGGKDAIYSGINLIESIKFLLKVKYSFIFSEYDWLRDEKAAAEEALQAAQLSLDRKQALEQAGQSQGLTGPDQEELQQLQQYHQQLHQQNPQYYQQLEQQLTNATQALEEEEQALDGEEDTMADDVEMDGVAEKYAIKIAEGISHYNTNAALHFKYTHQRDELKSIENELNIFITGKYPEGHKINESDLSIIKILRKITSVVNNKIFSDKRLMYDEETYVNSILIALQEMFDGFVSIRLADMDSAQIAQGMINSYFGSWFQRNTDSFFTLVTQGIFNMNPDLKQDYIAFLIGIARDVEEYKIDLVNQMVTTLGDPSESQYTLEDIDFVLKIIDKLSPGTFNYGTFSKLLNIYNENKKVFIDDGNFLNINEYKFFFKESIRIITNDFTEDFLLTNLNVVLKTHANDTISDVLNKNLLDMSIKTYVFPIFESDEFKSAFASGGYDEWLGSIHPSPTPTPAERNQWVPKLTGEQVATMFDNPQYSQQMQPEQAQAPGQEFALQQMHEQIQQQIQQLPPQQQMAAQQHLEQIQGMQDSAQQHELQQMYGQIQQQIQQIQEQIQQQIYGQIQELPPAQFLALQQMHEQIQQLPLEQQRAAQHHLEQIQGMQDAAAQEHELQQMYEQIQQQIHQIQQQIQEIQQQIHPSLMQGLALQQMPPPLHLSLLQQIQEAQQQIQSLPPQQQEPMLQQIQEAQQQIQSLPPQQQELMLQQLYGQIQQQIQGFRGGGNIQTGGDARAAITKFNQLLSLIETDPIEPLHFEQLDESGLRLPPDSSDIEDDDGEHYKQFADDLLAGSDPDPAKATQINSAIEKYLGLGVGVIATGVKPTLKLFNSIIKQCKNQKKQVTKHINENLKGAYERGKAAHYMNHLEGFTFLELYEVMKLLNGNLTTDSELQTLFSSLYVLTPMIGAPEQRGKITRPQKKKLDLLDELNNMQRVELPKNTLDKFKDIKDKIKEYEYYNKYLSKIIDFLNDQKIYYGSSPKNLTKAEKVERSLVFTEILNYYLPGFGEWIKNRSEWFRLFQVPSGRPSGGSLDNKLWNIVQPSSTKYGFRDYLARNGGEGKYVNNAIPSRCAKILSEEPFKFIVKCFTSVIDPMGTFGDCYPVPDPNIEGNIKIEIVSDANNYMKIHLRVNKTRNITLTGSVEIKITGSKTVTMDTGEFTIYDFAKSKPLSIANTVQLLREHDPEHNARQIVRKFLGDFLQGVEAIDKDLLYLSGDKPATVMYYLLHYLKFRDNRETLGGYVEKSDGTNCNIYIHNQNIISALAHSQGSNLGGGGLKDKKRVRRSRKRRTNRRKKTNRKKKTPRRKTTKRRSNRRNTNKRRTVRRKNSKRRSTRRKK